MGIRKKDERGRMFNFCLEDIIANNVNEKREVTFKSLTRYLSIPEEDKQRLIEEAKSSPLVICFSDRQKKKRKRLL